MGRAQLVSAGVSTESVDVRLERRRLIALHRGVYAVGHKRLRNEGRWLAAVLAAGPGAVLSHRDAATLHGLRPATGRSRVNVTTPLERRSTSRIEIRGRRQLDAVDRTTVGGVPVTTVARTLVDLAEVVSGDQLARALNEAEVLRLLDIGAIEAALARTSGRRGRGHAAMRAVLDAHRAVGTQLVRSELERRFVALVERAGIPAPQMNARVAGFEVDALWPQQQLAVELDGLAYHGTRRALRRDRRKDAALTLAGCTVVRFTHHDVVEDTAYVIATLRALLAAA